MLAASCIRKPAPGMKVETASERAKLVAQDGLRAAGRRPAGPRAAAHDPNSQFWQLGRQARRRRQPLSRARAGRRPTAAIRRWRSTSTPASSARSASAPAARCRSTTSSAWPAAAITRRSSSTSTIPMGDSTCVACGECVQACPTGALMPATLLDANGVARECADREVDSLCPYCGVGCQLTYHIKDDRIVARRGPRRAGQPQPALRQGPLRLRLRHHPHRLTEPLIRKAGVPKRDDRRSIRPTRGRTSARRAGKRRSTSPPAGLKRIRDRDGRQRPRRLRLGQGLERGGLSVPEARAHRVRHQQCRPLHAALPRLDRRGADGGHRLGRGHRAVHRAARRRRDHRHRRQPDRQPPGRRDLHQERRQARRQADRHRPARPGPGAARDPHAALQAGTDVALLNAMLHTIIEEGLYDRQYVEAHTEDFEKLREHVRGLFARSRWRRICGIDAGDLARMSRGPTRAPRRRSSSGAWASRSTCTAPTTPAA